MHRPDLPLTLHERDEWGDPVSDPVVSNYIATYCPCFNAAKMTGNGSDGSIKLTSAFISVGLNDTRVGAWESIRFAQKVRAARSKIQKAAYTDDLTAVSRTNNSVIVKLLPGCGHQGPQAEEQLLTLLAEEMAFLQQAIK